MTKLTVKNGKLEGNPLSGVENYDLTRLSRLQQEQLGGIINKAKGQQRLTASDVQNLANIRRAAKFSKAETHTANRSSIDHAAALARQLKEVFS